MWPGSKIVTSIRERDEPASISDGHVRQLNNGLGNLLPVEMYVHVQACQAAAILGGRKIV